MADELQPGPEPAEVDIDSLSPEQVTEQIASLKQGKPAKLKRAPEEAPDEERPAPQEAKPTAEVSGDDDEFKGQETVPHGTFHRANQRRKEAEERASKAEQERQVAFQRLSELLESQQRQQAAQIAEEPEEPDLGPDPDADPIGALRWAREQLAVHDKREREARQRQTEEGQRQAYINSVVETAGDQWRTALEARPELSEADDYLMKSYGNELAAMGWQPHQINQKLREVSLQQAIHAQRSKRPIGEYIEQLAKARGWQATPKAIPGQELVETPARDAQGRFTKEAEKMEALNAAKSASLSLGNGGPAVKTGPLTAQDIVNMTPDEYAAFKDKFGEKGLLAAAQRRA